MGSVNVEHVGEEYRIIGMLVVARRNHDLASRLSGAIGAVAPADAGRGGADSESVGGGVGFAALQYLPQAMRVCE